MTCIWLKTIYLQGGLRIFDISQQSILMLVWLGCTGNLKMRVGSRIHLSHPKTLGAKQSQQPGHILSEQTSDVRASWPEQNQSWWRSGCFGKRGGEPSSFQHRQVKINNFDEVNDVHTMFLGWHWTSRTSPPAFEVTQKLCFWSE